MTTFTRAISCNGDVWRNSRRLASGNSAVVTGYTISQVSVIRLGACTRRKRGETLMTVATGVAGLWMRPWRLLFTNNGDPAA